MSAWQSQAHNYITPGHSIFLQLIISKTCDMGKKGVKGLRCLAQLALSVAALRTGDERAGQ